MKLNKFDSVLESFTPIKVTSRLFYPRKFALSEEFIKTFKQEYTKLIKEGQNPKHLQDRIFKALRFHI